MCLEWKKRRERGQKLFSLLLFIFIGALIFGLKARNIQAHSILETVYATINTLRMHRRVVATCETKKQNGWKAKARPKKITCRILYMSDVRQYAKQQPRQKTKKPMMSSTVCQTGYLLSASSARSSSVCAQTKGANVANRRKTFILQYDLSEDESNLKSPLLEWSSNPTIYKDTRWK